MRRDLRLSLLSLTLLSACGSSTPEPEPPPNPIQPVSSQSAPIAAAQPPPLATRPDDNRKVTLLFTTDEHGWLEGISTDGVKRGGAAELLGKLVQNEHHCPGALPAGFDAQGALGPLSPEDCKDPSTLLLSSGDNFTGPAITTYLAGEPMGPAMARLGYAASAFGNHELDFGREQFLKIKSVSKVPYLAANMEFSAARVAADFGVKPFQIFERKGIKIGVIGLAAADTLTTAMAERFVGITIAPIEPSLDKAVKDAYAQGADALVVTAHECPTELVPIVAKHPEWQLAFVGGGHCHKVHNLRAADVAIMSPASRMHQYTRVEITVNPKLPPRSRVVSVSPVAVDVIDSAGSTPDPALQKAVAGWKATVDKALGVTIGETKTGIAPERLVGQMVADAWLAELGGDVAIMNKGGARQTIPQGAITKATLWSVLPFDNNLMKLSITGEDLQKHLEMPFAIAAGARKDEKGNWKIGKKPLDPKKRYSLITTDFVYTGGDGAQLQKADPKAVALGIQWRDPVIAWIEKQKTTQAKPLEGKLITKPKKEIPLDAR